MLCLCQRGGSSILHSSRAVSISISLCYSRGWGPYTISIYNAAYFFFVSYYRQTHSSLLLENGTRSSDTSFFKRHREELWLSNNQHYGAVAAHPLLARQDPRPSPGADSSRNGHAKDSHPQSTSIHLCVQLLALTLRLSLPTTSRLTSRLSSSILSPNSPQSFVSEYGSSACLVHASFPSSAAATAYLFPNPLIQPPSHHHDRTA